MFVHPANAATLPVDLVRAAASSGH